jgi:CheY-like chemotaxis protein
MSNKTRVLHVRVVGFSAPERQMLNSIFLLSVAPARQIGYKLWNPETGTAPDMYLLDGDSESAVASWQATFASTSDRTLVVGSKNLDLGVASASRPLGIKVVGAMDRLAIALNNIAEAAQARDFAAGLDVSAPGPGGTLPTSAPDSAPASAPKQEQTLARVTSGMTSQQPAMSASMNAMAPMSAAANTLAAAANTLSGASNTLTPAARTMSSSPHSMTAGTAAATQVEAMPVTMTAAAPAATVLPNMTLQPSFEKSLSEKPVTEKTVDKILSEKQPEKITDKVAEKAAEKAQLSPHVANLQASGVTPLSPSALSAAVAPTTSATSRVNLRVIPTPPLASSLPTSAPMMAKAAEAPLHAAPAPHVPPPTLVMPAPAMPTPVGGSAHMARHEEHNFRVLAVDDSPLMRTFLKNKLEPYGIAPEFASSGEEALFKISKQHFDLIFLDVMLPGMDGYDVCKMIKKNKDNALMKVVMLTSKDKTFDKIRGTMAGCDGYLTKPVDEMKLRAIIERHSVAQK